MQLDGRGSPRCRSDGVACSLASPCRRHSPFLRTQRVVVERASRQRGPSASLRLFPAPRGASLERVCWLYRVAAQFVHMLPSFGAQDLAAILGAEVAHVAAQEADQSVLDALSRLHIAGAEEGGAPGHRPWMELTLDGGGGTRPHGGAPPPHGAGGA